MLPKITCLDLTQTLANNAVPISPILPTYHFWAHLTLENGDIENCYQSLVSDHTGTHVDAASHVHIDGKTLTDYPVDAWSGPGLSLDFREYDGKEITPEIVKQAEAKALRPIQEGDIVLFCTGHSYLWAPMPEGHAYMQNRARLTLDTADYLVEKKVKGIGVDMGGPDNHLGKNFPVHEILLGKDILIIESLHKLDLLFGKEFYFACFPAKIGGGSGAITRAVAMFFE